MARIVHEERGMTRRRVNSIIQCKFRERKERTPTFDGVNEAVQNIFEHAINAFGLTVCLGMSSGGH